ncbi:SDR family oxidoreductase [Patescibacteria group bacterium]|nr:SDR family oxidoreductase [Patescibacteria group bacterium]
MKCEHKSIQEMFNLKGQTAVVTGGAMGIGYGIACRLAEAGANIVIADMAEDQGQAKAAELQKHGASAIFIKTDVSSEQDVTNLIKQTLEKFGRLDIFVNNAGIFPHIPVLDMSLDFWEKTQAVNLRGQFLCCREAGTVMAKASKGVIINIGSIDSLHPSNVGLAAYDASKHGVWGLTKNFALEMGPKGVRVNAIAPGGVATEGVGKMLKLSDGADTEKILESMKSFAQTVPLGRVAEPDDIAKVALFLASDASEYMTGTITVVDGGTLLA